MKPSRADRIYMLRGLMRCGLCNGPMYGYTYHKKTPKGIAVYSYYRCQNTVQKGTSVCKCMSVSADELEKEVESKILALSEDRQFLNDRE